MNYELEIESSFPAVFEPFTGTRPPLVAGSGTASLLTSTPTTVPFSAFTQTRENSPFSLECWYLPVNVNGTVVVMGHTTDGVIFDGSTFSLSIPHAGGTVVGSWKPTQIMAFHVVLTYDGDTYVLYVNADPVIQVDRAAGAWTNTQTPISFNRPIAATSSSAVYDSAAVYYRALGVEEVVAHYGWAKQALVAERASAASGGNPYTLTYDAVNVATSVRFDKSNWSTGAVSNVSITDYLLTDTGGTWITSVPLEALTTSPAAGVHLTCIGNGFTLAYSTDGTSWTAAANKRTILEDANITGVALDVRITLADQNSWVESLVIDVLGSRVMTPFSGSKFLTFKGAAMDQTPGHQLDYQADHGAQIKAGYIEIQPDLTETPETVSSIEAWIKFDGTSGQVLSAAGGKSVSLGSGSLTTSGVTTYINGSAGSSVTSGQWNHYVFTFSTAVSTAIRLGDLIGGGSALDMTVGHLATYPTALSAAQALALYKLHIGANVIRVDDTSTIGVTESVPSTDIYAYNWSVLATER